MEKRMNIGLVVSHLKDDFASAVCKGAINGAKEIDANLFIIPVRYLNDVQIDRKHDEYDYQYNTLFSYVFPEDIDILLVLADAIGSTISNEKKKDFLLYFNGMPVITVASKVDGYASISFDNKSGIKECIEHLINDHKCTKIGFVSGPKTNEDAIERFNVYVDVLQDAGIEYNIDRVAYGKFSTYSYNAVNELLDRCPDLEAIVFANDAMASGAYEVFEERGIEIGKDIFITGFDDSSVAANLIPTLTTVRADASELGYSAVMECFEYMKTGVLNSKRVRSTLIRRQSCGCKTDTSSEFTYRDVFVFNYCWCRSDEQTINAISKFLFDNYIVNIQASELKEIFDESLRNVFRVLLSDNHGRITLTEDAIEKIPKLFEAMLSYDMLTYVSQNKLCHVIDYLIQRFSAGLDSPEDKKRLSSVFISLYQIMMRAVVNFNNKRIDEVEFLTWQSNSIAKDMLLFDSYDDHGYGSVTDKLMRLNIASSYIYIFPETLSNRKNETWIPPSKVLLKSYHNKDIAEIVPLEEQEIHIRHLFNHKYIPKDRRVTMVLSPIFINLDHYGLFLCELEYEYFYYISSLSSQLCAAMKILRLIQDKENIRQELEQTLLQIKERNLILDNISKIDDLTSVYNRRGFFTQANSIICSPINEGRDALIVFADINSLKIINDSFSHEDGDFAIKNAAKILRDSFRSSDIIGRIGGDEFSVLAMVENATSEEVIEIVRTRVEMATDAFNQTHDKPYVVNMSVGVYAFKCSHDIELSKILARADNLLYDEKKTKKSILR